MADLTGGLIGMFILIGLVVLGVAAVFMPLFVAFTYGEVRRIRKAIESEISYSRPAASDKG